MFIRALTSLFADIISICYFFFSQFKKKNSINTATIATVADKQLTHTWKCCTLRSHSNLFQFNSIIILHSINILSNTKRYLWLSNAMVPILCVVCAARKTTSLSVSVCACACYVCVIYRKPHCIRDTDLMMFCQHFNIDTRRAGNDIKICEL